MQSEKLLNYFHMICTDNNPKIPPQIKSTPTLIIKGVPHPYVASDAFAWLAKVKQWKLNIIKHNMSMAQKQYIQKINSNLMSNDMNLLGFSKAEMDGLSDIFAYLQNENAMPHSYVNYDNLGKENIFTPPLEDGGYKVNDDAKYKINSAKQKELYTKLELERNKQDSMFKKAIEDFKKQYNQN
jgi:hypothetical protein